MNTAKIALQSLVTWACLAALLCACAVFVVKKQYPEVVEYLKPSPPGTYKTISSNKLEAYQEGKKEYILIALGTALVISQIAVVLAHTGHRKGSPHAG